MEYKEFIVSIAPLRAVFGEKFLTQPEAIEIWWEIFKEYETEVFRDAVKRYIMTGQFPPVPKNILDMISANITERLPNGEEAWALVYKAICNSGYHAQEEYDKLPRVIQKAVGTPHILKEYAMMPIDEVMTVSKSNFLRAYKVEESLAYEEAKLPKSFLEKQKNNLIEKEIKQ